MNGPVSRSMRRRRTLLGRLSVLVLLLLGVAHTGSFVHDLAVRHAVCEEHGERIEVAEAVPQHAPVDAFAATDAATEGASAHGHDHCVVGSTVNAARNAAPADQSTVIAITRGEHPPQDGPHFGGIAVYRLAPKNSPPSDRA